MLISVARGEECHETVQNFEILKVKSSQWLLILTVEEIALGIQFLTPIEMHFVESISQLLNLCVLGCYLICPLRAFLLEKLRHVIYLCT